MPKQNWVKINKWKKKHYKPVQTRLKIELVERWEMAIAAEGITKAEFIRNAIEKYLEELEK